VSKPKTDITPDHHPHEYELLAPEGYPIYIGTEEQCKAQRQAIWDEHPVYATNCKIVKV